MRRSIQIAIIAIFIVVFGSPLVLFLAGVRPTIDENRARTKFPGLDAHAAVNDATYSQIAAAYTDRLPFRDHALEFYSRMQDVLTFTDAVRPGLPRGADGWLYFPDDLLAKCGGPPPSDFVQSGQAAAEATKAAGVPFYFLVAPDKVSVYPEHLPKEGVAGVLGLHDPDDLQCTTQWHDAIDDATADQPWLKPLVGSLVERKSETDEALYFKQDTHWTDFGALSEVEEMLNDVAPGMWDPSEVEQAGMGSKIGDLSRLVGRPQREEAQGYRIVRPGVTITGNAPEDLNDDTVTVVRTKATSTDAPLVKGTTLFISDSFGRRSVKLLAPYFEDLVVVSREQLINQPIKKVLPTRPDRIIIEQVQRNVAKGWYTQGFDAVSDAMKLPSGAG